MPPVEPTRTADAEGYVEDIPYTYGYQPDLDPVRMKRALRTAGIEPPVVATACELGYGQGLSLAIHAVAGEASWWGNDLLTVHVQELEALTRGLTDRLHVTAETFEEFCSREDLPGFELIALHGIWSWISRANRAVIVDFLRRKLKVGGVLYISYNTLPGWSGFAPMRKLMAQHAEVMAAQGAGRETRVNGAIDFIDRLNALNPMFSRANPQIAERMEKIKTLSRNYLAHEYFNADWEPMYFSDLHDHLSQAKLNYACSANLMESVDVVNLTPSQIEFLSQIPHVAMRETMRDFIGNLQFRRDYWVKGSHKLDRSGLRDALGAMRVVLHSPPDSIALTIKTPVGEASLSEAVYKPFIQALADHKPHSLGEISQVLSKAGIDASQLIQCVILLVSMSHLSVVQEASAVSQAAKTANAFNLQVMQMARGNDDIHELASPVTGGGFSANRFVQLFLLARLQGQKTPRQWAEFAWRHIKEYGQSILKEGKALQGEEENLAELTALAEQFEQKQLPLYKALQIA